MALLAAWALDADQFDAAAQKAIEGLPAAQEGPAAMGHPRRSGSGALGGPAGPLAGDPGDAPRRGVTPGPRPWRAQTPAVTVNGVQTTYGYDALDRLVSVSRAGTVTERFRYVNRTGFRGGSADWIQAAAVGA